MPRPWVLSALALCTACAAATSPPNDPGGAPAATASASASASACYAPEPGPERRRWFIDSKRVGCEGEGVRECLRARASATEEWSLFYRTIEGFTFEPGFVYELELEAVPAPDAPADAPTTRLRLVNILSKTKETP
ncbi:MAG: DUF4377 domain-containing protein [Deltaproteobacteria bacterium]|nr:DUF4377 domain-containing protein [Deltaproteobacteria bacterium]